jgi:endogenous inhibitor of DNA gyrase (YacG/DUF329 family)
MEVLMNYLRERVAYLKGLADGMKLDTSTNEGKLLRAILEVLDDMALAVDDIEEAQELLSEQVDEIDDDLADIENLLYGVDEEDEEEYYDDEDDDEAVELECPHCGETVDLEDAFMRGNTVLCPHCGKEIEIEFECECEDCEDGVEDTGN